VPTAAMPRWRKPCQRPASRDAQPPPDVPGTSRSTPRQDGLARRPRGWPSRTAVSSGRLPCQPLVRQPRAATPSARLVDVASTASARRRSVAIRCCPSMIAPACARRLHDERAHRVPGEQRNITRPVPPPAAPTLSSTPRHLQGGSRDAGSIRGPCGAGRHGVPPVTLCAITVLPIPHHVDTLTVWAMDRYSGPRVLRGAHGQRGHSLRMATPWEHQRPPSWTALVTAD
jgi:hypothetical protein